jgi:hypothetical protein
LDILDELDVMMGEDFSVPLSPMPSGGLGPVEEADALYRLS